MNGQRLLNPFEIDIVADPERSLPTDVPSIHEKAFGRCCAAYEKVAQEHRSWSALLFGEAGCGKTHVLSRFRNWLNGDTDPKPTMAPCLFVAVRMETGPAYVWRHLRRRFASELTRQLSDGSTILDRILNDLASRSGGRLPEALDRASLTDTGLDLIRVLEHFAAGKLRRLCRHWLAGDALTETDKQSLQIGMMATDEVEEDLAEHDSRRIVLALTRLCAPALVVFCFDQVEALGLSQQSHAYSSFSRMGAALIDTTENSLVISTMLATFLRDLEDSSPTDFARIGKEQIDLHPLNWNSATQLVQSRLSLVPELAGQHPIAETDLRAFFDAQHGRCNPRALIQECRRLFDRWQQTPPRPRKTPDQFLQQEFDRFLEQSPALRDAAETDAVLGHGLPVLFQLLDYRVQERPRKHVDLAVEGHGTKLAVAYGNHADMRSYASWLKHVKEQKTDATVCVLRDARRAVSSGAKAARERLEKIAQLGGRIIRVDAEAVAALDAMRRLLAQATSGDLSQDGRDINAQTVREWLMANLPRSVAGLAEQLTGGRPGPPTPDALLELLETRKVIPLEEAAHLSRQPRERIEEYARSHPDQIHLFGGACPVVCQAVVATAPGAANGAA